MPDLGVRLKLLIGPNVPKPAPMQVMDSLVSLEVTNKDRERDGFQLTFQLGKSSLSEYGLLQSGILDPPSRVIIAVTVRSQSQVLIDGVITNHQVVPSNEPGKSTLVVTGEDLSLQLDLEEKNATYPNQSDSTIVQRILSSYAKYGLVPDVKETQETPMETERIPNQQGTDLTFLNEMARRNGFIFYIEPKMEPGSSTAYWGPENRLGRPQPALTMNMGPDTNVDTSISFSYNALGPADPQASFVEPSNKLSVPLPPPIGVSIPLTIQQAMPMRKTIIRDTANLNSIQAGLRATSAASKSANAVTATGEIDAMRYGRVLQARKLVDMRGVGNSNDGTYYVKQVIHRINRSSYKQNFTLEREGRGASSKQVVA
jgi:hypothetical protein